MLYLVLILILMIHFLASVWFLFTKHKQVWVPPLDFVFAGQYPETYRYWSNDHGDFYRYIINFYNGLLFLGGNEMGPRTTVEFAMSTSILICMSIFNASLFGEIAVVTEMSRRKDRSF